MKSAPVISLLIDQFFSALTKQKKIFLMSTSVQKDDILIYFFISKEMGNGEVKSIIYVTALINYINRRKEFTSSTGICNHIKLNVWTIFQLT